MITIFKTNKNWIQENTQINITIRNKNSKHNKGNKSVIPTVITIFKTNKKVNLMKKKLLKNQFNKNNKNINSHPHRIN